MTKKSAGILAYRKKEASYEVFLVHPGGPFWAKKDLNSWSVPKGEFNDDEEPLLAAKREFKEETGFDVEGKFIEMEPVKQPGGKVVYTWAVEAYFDASEVKSNTFTIEWPPKSGLTKEFHEIDKAGWFPLGVAREKILKGQAPLLEQIAKLLSW